jgi:hypothetical protein
MFPECESMFPECESMFPERASMGLKDEAAKGDESAPAAAAGDESHSGNM